MTYQESLSSNDFTVYCPVDHKRTANIQGELDSGAEILVVPRELVDELHLMPRRVMIAQSYDGTQSQWATYMVDLEIEGYPVSDVEVIALPRQDAILGRDVLNQFIVTLDGKELTFEVTDP
jgi:predicted aspartyl protease